MGIYWKGTEGLDQIIVLGTLLHLICENGSEETKTSSNLGWQPMGREVVIYSRMPTWAEVMVAELKTMKIQDLFWNVILKAKYNLQDGWGMCRLLLSPQLVPYFLLPPNWQGTSSFSPSNTTRGPQSTSHYLPNQALSLPLSVVCPWPCLVLMSFQSPPLWTVGKLRELGEMLSEELLEHRRNSVNAGLFLLPPRPSYLCSLRSWIWWFPFPNITICPTPPFLPRPT